MNVPPHHSPRTVGVEEELLVVDPATGTPRAVASAVLRRAVQAGEAADLTGELQLEQLETGTRPCIDLDDLAAELDRTRRIAVEAAAAEGVGVAPLAICPVPVEPTVAPAPRYRRMIDRFGVLGRQQLTCGCHVHVGVESDEEGVAVLDRIRPWLAPLLALTANSPFSDGQDTGYASFRSQVWGRWPSAGPTDVFGSADEYARVEAAMVATDTVLDAAMLYFDARLSRRHPTIEVRVADVCREADDAVLTAALVRALVDTAAAAWRRGEPPAPVRTDILRLASWRAGRSGLGSELVDPRSGLPAPAAEVLDGLLEHVGPALTANGDADRVAATCKDLLSRGTGADRQRAVFARTASLTAVVSDAVLPVP